MVDLTSNLFPVDSPIARNQGQVSAFQFDSDNERGVISAAKVRNFSFSQGQGGTITLGGTSNGNGVMQVLNSSGGTVVTANNTGIAVYGGSITIQNTSGSNTLDSSGIVSLNGFSFTNGTAGDQDISGASEVYLTGGTLSYVLARSAVVLYFIKYQGYMTTGTASTANITTRLRIDTNDVERAVFGAGVNTALHTPMRYIIRTESAGTHTINITGQLESPTGSPIFRYQAWGMSYIILGT